LPQISSFTFVSLDVCTGANKDFQQATAIASAMVKHFGMSEKVSYVSQKSYWHFSVFSVCAKITSLLK